MGRQTTVIDRRRFLQGTAGAALGLAAAPASGPNVLIVLADQWRAGDKDLKTPNLNKLAREGLQFDRAYSAYPSCTPSRAALLTGRFPHSISVMKDDAALPATVAVIASVLKQRGYRTGYIGQWRLDGKADPGFVPPGERRHGFDDWSAFNRGYRYFDSVYYRDLPGPIRVAGFEPDDQTGLAIDFVRKSQPFLLVLSWGPPHPPRTPPPKYAQFYNPRDLTLRDNVPGDRWAAVAKDHAAYYGLCSALDDNIGRLLAALDGARVAENTIVVFTSDHGDLLGSHGGDGAESYFEESSHVPLIVRYPGKLTADQSAMPVSGVDLMPTLLGFCGAEIPENAQGRDLSSLLLSGQGDRPESIYAQGRLGTKGEWRMIVRGLDKLVVGEDLSPAHLYNLGLDPFEEDDLVGDSGQRVRRDELLALLRIWMKRVGDRMDPSGLRRR